MPSQKATREHVVTDQGNGGAYCSNCGYDLTSKMNPDFWANNSVYNYFLPVPNPCPGCGLEWEEGGTYINYGGSDF